MKCDLCGGPMNATPTGLVCSCGNERRFEPVVRTTERAKEDRNKWATLINNSEFQYGLSPEVEAPPGWRKIEDEHDWLMIESPDGRPYFAMVSSDRRIHMASPCLIADEQKVREFPRFRLGQRYVGKDTIYF